MKSCHLDFPEENLFTPKVPCRKKKKVEKKINQNSIATTTKKTLISLYKDYITGFCESEMNCTYTVFWH